MRIILLALLLGFFSNSVFSQEQQDTIHKKKIDFSIFDNSKCPTKFFISTNSGIYNTPLGLRVGFMRRTGFYVGARFGQGIMFDYGGSGEGSGEYQTGTTNLFSVTGGLIAPLYVKNSFSLHTFFGAGYGEWFPKRRESWTQGGYELEFGFMTTYKRVMLNFSANMLNGNKTYATWDATVGIGYRF